MPGVMKVSEAAGRLVRQAREQRGWTVPELSVELGRIGNPPHVLAPTQLSRIEQGGRNISPDEAWRLIEVLHELDPLELLEAALVLDPNSSEAFRDAVREEAERRRRLWAEGFRRYDMTALAAAHANVVSRGILTLAGHDAAPPAPPVDGDLGELIRRNRGLRQVAA